MLPDSPRAFVRTIVIGLAAVALALLAALIGGKLAPGVKQVEQKVVAPAVNAVRRGAPAVDRAGMIAGACPALVAIETAAGAPSPAGGAIGFLVSADGYLVTSARRTGAGAAPRARLGDGRRLDARRVASDDLSGIALFKVEAEGLPYLSFADEGLPPVGASGIALAAPLAQGCIAAAAMVGGDFQAEGPGARVYARLRPAPEPIFAGAPVLNDGGEVIGIAGLGGAAGDTALLLPGSTAGTVVSTLMRRGGGATNEFGFIAQDLNPALATRIGVKRQQGAMIALVAPRSAAARAGLQAGDVIFTAAGTPIANATELARALDGAGDVVTIDVRRREDRISITMRLRRA